MEILARSRTSTAVLRVHGVCSSIRHLCVPRNKPYYKKSSKGNKKYLEGCMMYECKCCGMWFFLEEGYESETDRIVCPACGHVVDEIEMEV